MSDQPLISIIMNCHNGEKYLKDLSDDELKELIDYSIQTGGMG